MSINKQILSILIVIITSGLLARTYPFVPLDSIKRKCKGKVAPLLLTEHDAMKAYWGVEVYPHSFFDLGTRLM